MAAERPLLVQLGSPTRTQVMVLPAAGTTNYLTLTGSNGGKPKIGANNGRIDLTAIPHLPSYTVATLPTPSVRAIITVSNGADGWRLAVSDGLSWLWPDGTTVS